MVIPGLGPGGAERVLLRLAEHWSQAGHAVSVVTFETSNTDFYRLPSAVHRVVLDAAFETTRLREKLRATHNRLQKLRLSLERLQPDLVVSFLPETNVLVLLATWGRRYPVVITEHSCPQHFPTVGLWRLARRLTYGFATRLVSVSAGVDRYFGWIPRTHRRIIPNAISLQEIDRIGRQEPPWPWPHAVAAMGRLEKEKGFDLLLAAFAQLANSFPDWGLVILGEGTQKPPLRQQAARLGIADRIFWAGTVNPPYGLLRAADLFAFPSRHEGFGIALVEAMACGLPLVASNCRPGPGELIDSMQEGLLIPPGDAPSLCEALRTLMSDANLRAQMTRAARKKAEQFDLPHLMPRWDQLLDELLTTRRITSER